MSQFNVPQDLADRQVEAINYCKQKIAWYRSHGARESLFYRLFQTCALVFGALAPIFILWSDIPKPLQALPAVLAAIAVGVVSVFQWRQNWGRFASTAEALEGELLKYQTRTSPGNQPGVPEDVALSNFVNAIQNIIASETSDWHTQQTTPPPGKSGNP